MGGGRAYKMVYDGSGYLKASTQHITESVIRHPRRGHKLSGSGIPPREDRLN